MHLLYIFLFDGGKSRTLLCLCVLDSRGASSRRRECCTLHCIGQNSIGRCGLHRHFLVFSNSHGFDGTYLSIIGKWIEL